ncbi:ras-related protein Rab-21-like isoform X2 [Artemia franciscana]
MGIQPTIGASYYPSKIEVNGVTLNLQVWDTAGQERFRSMAPMYYRNADAAILVFDLTDLDSFCEAQFWVSELQRNAEMHVCKCLVGNKCDLAARKVSKERAEEYARMIDAEYFEASAAQGKGMDKVFSRIAEDVLGQYSKEPEFKYWGIKESPSSSRLSTLEKEESVNLTDDNLSQRRKKDGQYESCCT